MFVQQTGLERADVRVEESKPVLHVRVVARVEDAVREFVQVREAVVDF